MNVVRAQYVRLITLNVLNVPRPLIIAPQKLEGKTVYLSNGLLLVTE